MIYVVRLASYVSSLYRIVGETLSCKHTVCYTKKKGKVIERAIMEKILFLEWKSFGNEFIIRTFQKMGYQIVILEIDRDHEDLRNSPIVSEQIARKILAENPKFVFSFNYFPVAAIACKACRTPYLSWVYDSPYILMYSKTIEFDTNHVFVFDQQEALKFQAMGVKTVAYLSMAAATEYYDQMIPQEIEHRKYDSDITFIGSMYSEKKQHLFRHLENLDEYTKGYVESLMKAQKQLYGMDLIQPALTQDIVEKMKRVCPVEAHGDGLESEAWVFANYFLARKVTAMERFELLKALSERFHVTLFTPEDTKDLPKVHNMGKIDYYDQAPFAMKCAKINLNISLRSIHSGMPLRALDILGCGGFLLTNYQSDFLEYFVQGKDFVYYESIDEVPDLVEYYLKHEDERCEIARSGYHKVKEHLNYERQIQKMLAMSFERD